MARKASLPGRTTDNSIVELVYGRLYDTPYQERLKSEWLRQLHCQLLAMRKALSFMLTPCVEHVMSFLELDDALVHVCLLLQERSFDLGIPTIRRSVVSFLDIRFGVRRVLRAIVLQYFWNNYVGRPPDFKGSVMHWRRVCQEIADYQYAHGRCVCDNVRVSRFREQLDNLCYRIDSTE